MLSFAEGESNVQFTGGTLYEIEAIKVLSQKYDVKINTNFIKKGNVFQYIFKSHKKLINAEICFLDPYVLALGKFDKTKINIAIIHHIDHDIANRSFIAKYFFNRILVNLKKMDNVVVVSKYWKDYLQKKGVKNIELIYNSFKLPVIDNHEEQYKDLKERIGINDTKPIVYLGKNSQGKGVEDILDNIDKSKYNLVVSGKNKHPDKNVYTYFFADEEFLVFLSMCNVVLAMSTMIEGWNRIAHEALLVKTPVIGSGSGGMKELLINAQQKVVSNLKELEVEIDDCIINSAELGEKGYQYVSQFNMSYFKKKWFGLINKFNK